MSDPAALVELQQIDARADQLRRDLAALPESALLRERAAELVALDAEEGRLQERRQELTREERRREQEVEAAREKAREVEETLYSGRVKLPRELAAYQQDLRLLRQRQTELEEQELAVMEQEEQVEGELARIAARRAEIERESESLRAVVSKAEGEVAAALEVIAGERAAAQGRMSSPVVAAYEKARRVPRLGGMVVAKLVGESCGGCRISLPFVEAARIRRTAADTVGYCPQCGRLLVP
jgi:predicted  nucleic acid-binding Zn-ribbon protein